MATEEGNILRRSPWKYFIVANLKSDKIKECIKFCFSQLHVNAGNNLS